MKCFRKPISLLLCAVMTTGTFFGYGFQPVSAAETNTGMITLAVAEDIDYSETIKIYAPDETMSLDDEKISMYLKGCTLYSQTASRIELKVADSSVGAMAVFVAPEAGRKTGSYKLSDFSGYINSSLQIRGIDTILLEKTDGVWNMTLGDENNHEPALYLVDNTKSWNEKLVSSGNGEDPYILELENYTLSREGYVFEMYHNFSPGCIIYQLDQKTITFESEEITFRTFETRLSEESEQKSIVVDRKPPQTIIGSVIRFTGDSDDGDNLALVTAVDSANNQISIRRYDNVSYNDQEEGTWLRCYAEESGGTSVDNVYPKINLEPTVWSLSGGFFNDWFADIAGKDSSGVLSAMSMTIEDAIGYSLRDVTYSYNGLNFTGGIVGAFDLEIDLNFFGQEVTVGPLRIDYGSMASKYTDQILRIDTYKKEAFRFYFNPEMFKSYSSFKDLDMPPDVFPLTFRLYFDKDFNLIGGNIRLALENGIPLPGGVASITAVGGGYTTPQTFEVSAVFQDGKLDDLIGRYFWRADTDLILSLDQAYLQMDGKVWLWGRKFGLGSARATIAWDYYKGKKFKGIEFTGQTGVSSNKTELVIDLTFKVKKYKSDGETKFYAGGGGSAKVSAFGYTFKGIDIMADTEKVKCSVKVPIIGTKSIKLYWADASDSFGLYGNGESLYGSLSSGSLLSGSEADSEGVATLLTEEGHRIVLIPEAKKIEQPAFLTASLGSGLFGIATEMPLTLDHEYKEAAITVNYFGSASGIRVTFPDMTERDVEIASAETVEDADHLYAMDYEIDEETGERQLYIQLKNAVSGDYTVHLDADSASGQSIYEIRTVPSVEDGSAAALLDDDIVTLEWDLEEEVENTRYHLSMQQVDAEGNELENWPLYEDKILETEGTNGEDPIVETQELYVDEAAVTTSGKHASINILLPSNLPEGNYRFIVEPVRVESGEDPLYGQIGISNAVIYTGANINSIVKAPTDITISNIGNGILRAEWLACGSLSGWLAERWNVTIKDGEEIVGVASLDKADVVNGVNSYNNVLDKYVYLDIGAENNKYASFHIPDLEYGKDYTVEISAIKDASSASGAYYNNAEDYIEMDNILADQNGGTITYCNTAQGRTRSFIEPKAIEFDLALYQKNGVDIVFSLAAIDDSNLSYDYENDIEILSEKDIGHLVVRSNVMDVIKMLPTEDINKLGLQILGADGEEIFYLPPLTLASLTDISAINSLQNELNSIYPNMTNAFYEKYLAIQSSGAFQNNNGNVIFSLDQIEDMLPEFEPGRYTVTLTAYNANNDISECSFALNLTDIDPSVFLDTITKTGTSSYTITGMAYGAETVEINGETIEVSEDGSFSVTSSDFSEGELTMNLSDEYGSTFESSVEIELPASGSSAHHTNTDSTSETSDASQNSQDSDLVSVTASIDDSGQAFGAVTVAQVSSLIEKSLTGAEAGPPAVKVKVEASPDLDRIGADIPTEALTLMREKECGSLSIETAIATLSFDSGALETISGASGDTIQISTALIDHTTLSRELQEQIGDRPVYDFRVTSGNETISQFGGTVTVTIPYALKNGETPEEIVVYYINAAGNLETMTNCCYDAASGTIRLVTDHFSEYTIGYHDVHFVDVPETAWFSSSVHFIAARGIAEGTGNQIFQPLAKLTRADFLVMMMKAYGIEADDTYQDNFSDAGNTYYTAYLATAKALGLTSGKGDNQFAPKQQISRAEMFTLLYNTLSQIGQLPTADTGISLSNFSDLSETPVWAQSALEKFIQAGIIQGTDGKLNSNSQATRAESAQILSQLLSQ